MTGRFVNCCAWLELRVSRPGKVVSAFFSFLMCLRLCLGSKKSAATRTVRVVALGLRRGEFLNNIGQLYLSAQLWLQYPRPCEDWGQSSEPLFGGDIVAGRRSSKSEPAQQSLFSLFGQSQPAPTAVSEPEASFTPTEDLGVSGAAVQVGLFGAGGRGQGDIASGSGGAGAGVRSGAGRGRARETVPLPDWSSLPPLPDNVYFGTSSWTYPGWKGLIYSRTYRESGDTVPMLEEYSRCPLFGCVGADSTFYRPPSRKTLESYAAVLPTNFKVLGKAYDRITIQGFSNDSKWGEYSGQENPDFLNPELAINEVIGPWLECLKDKAGPLMFEFQTMYGPLKPTPEAWADMLEQFFGSLPREGQYGVELRNPELYTPPYLEALRRCGVTHVFNSWTRMPSVGEQLSMPGALTAPFVVARALLRPGRTYDQAVDKFAPYATVQEAQPGVREDLVQLIEDGLREHQKVYVLVNNRLEGNSPGTIQAIRKMIAERRKQTGN